MNIRFVIIMMVGIAIFMGLLLGKSKDADAPSAEETSPTIHVAGEGTAGVTLVEYGDFQCRACYFYYPVIKEVKAKYGDQITFQFRHFPITSIHPNAFAAHRAAEAAGIQGKFFEMHDLLYERLPSWENSSQPTVIFEQYAQELGLDMELYRQDVNSNEVNLAIRADMKSGNDIGVNATPTFLLNDRKLEEAPRDLEGFSRLIDELIKEKTGE